MSAAVCEGDLDLNEWVQNCLQLSGCFLDCNTFALSQHCCAAVEALLLRQHQLQLQGQARGQQEASDASCTTQDKDTASQQQQELGKQSAAPSSSANKDQSDGKDQAAKQQQQQQKDAASKGPLSQEQQQQHSEEEAAVPGGPSPALVAALALLESDVAANVCLAFAKLHLYTLVASHEVVLEGKQVDAAFSSAKEVPAVLCFDALPSLPPLSSLAWGSDAYAHTYNQVSGRDGRGLLAGHVEDKPAHQGTVWVGLLHPALANSMCALCAAKPGTYIHGPGWCPHVCCCGSTPALLRARVGHPPGATAVQGGTALVQARPAPLPAGRLGY